MSYSLACSLACLISYFIAWTPHWKREAQVAGGAVVCLLGNHEVMNACGDFRYTTPGGNRGFTVALETHVLKELGK